MNLDPSNEQRALADAVDSLMEKHYDANTRLDLLRSDAGWSQTMWKRYADMGLLGLTFEEQWDGAGMGTAELATVMECFGRALVLEPFVATVVLGGQLVARAGTTEQKSVLLPRVATGSLRLAFASAERGARWSQAHITTAATNTADGWTLTGEKTAVLGGDLADQIIVSARTPSGDVGLFLVDADAARRRAYAQQDGLGAADVLLTSTPAQMLGDGLADAADVIDVVVDLATAMLCSEAVGAMDRMLGLTVEYLRTRVQFGTPIGGFQALQHRASDMYVSLEQARSMALMAQLALATDDAVERGRAVQAAKVQIDVSARHIGQESIQLHGGIGMTLEYPLGHYVKRTAVIGRTFADLDTLVRSVGQGAGLVTVG